MQKKKKPQILTYAQVNWVLRLQSAFSRSQRQIEGAISLIKKSK